MQSRKIFSNIRGDMAGGAAAAMVTLPMSIGYGTLVFAPLGMDYAFHGALLGLFSALFSGFIAVLLGGSPIQISGPSGPLSLIHASVVAGLVARPVLAPAPSSEFTSVIALSSLCVLGGGLFQVVLGLLKLGNIARYVPYPVVSGLMNGVGLIVILSQIKPLLAIPQSTPLMDILAQPSTINWLSLMVGLATISSIFFLKHKFRGFPSPLVGLVIGTILSYILSHLTGNPSFLPFLDAVRFQWPDPTRLTEVPALLADPQIRSLLPELIFSGCIIGLLGSIESLLSSASSEDLTGMRHDGNRELIGQGVGNVVCSIFGALAASGSMVRTAANFKAGGRSRLSGVLCSGWLLLAVLILEPLMLKIPMPSVAAVMIYLGFNLFDGRPIRLCRMLASSRARSTDALYDLLVTLSVATIAISLNIVFAVLSGVFFASVLFIIRAGQSIIRREYTGQMIRSRKARQADEEEILRSAGDRIVVVELQGPLFFASAETLARRVEEVFESAMYCILDLRQVNEVDSTGAKVLFRIQESASRAGKSLLISSSNRDLVYWESMGKGRSDSLEGIFSDTDAALERAEEELIAQKRRSPCELHELALEQMEIFKGLSSDEIETLKRRLVPEHYEKGRQVFAEGGEDQDLYILSRGCVTVKARLRKSGQFKRFRTLTAGSVFGEMALLDGKPRSADAYAEEDSEVFRLSAEEFKRLVSENPALYAKLVLCLSRVSTSNLRRTDDETKKLE